MQEPKLKTLPQHDKKSKRLVGLFAAALLVMPTAGCANEIELCYDDNGDKYCDDDGSRYNPNSYVVIDGKKEAYIKGDRSYVSSADSGDSGGSDENDENDIEIDVDQKKYKSGIGSKSGFSSGG